MPLDTNQYRQGDSWVTCDVCGYRRFWSDVRRGMSGDQKGATVCSDCFDPIHEQEIKFKPRKERQWPPPVR